MTTVFVEQPLDLPGSAEYLMITVVCLLLLMLPGLKYVITSFASLHQNNNENTLRHKEQTINMYINIFKFKLLYCY